ncbi:MULTISPECIES: putative signal transducing protein [Flavobacteriaceae]|jgi:hypothetical protein|uniref:Signal transducing protein n=2 Tax=Flavobacteriaceae TaxID=49546 RepID=A0ABN1JTQ2_9FLAO|nr:MULTISPECIES: DUF2007 domain-containing protein [Flavobacteriaceae]TBV26890.1 DUF2007 domain-containing protein [Meridianimaribacter sp. CL38]TDY12576.1 putative signal transducing protein [Meridianimaribacter flavus]
MEDVNYIKVFSGNFIIVQLVLDRLQSIGINAIIKDESESGRLAGFGSSIQGFQELFVNKDELDNALPIVESVKSELKV